MMRLIAWMAILILAACAMIFPAMGGGAAMAQATRGECDMLAMPALPPQPKVPAPRSGYEWVPGHYRCMSGGWSFFPSRWERIRARAPASEFVTTRNKRLVPLTGYRFNRTGPNSVALARIRGGGVGRLSAVEGSFSCSCKKGGTGCAVALSGNALYCISQGCDDCVMTWNSGSKGVRAIAAIIDRRKIASAGRC